MEGSRNMNSACERYDTYRTQQDVEGLFLEDRVDLHSQSREDDERGKGNPSGAVDHALIPDIWVSHTPTEHQDQSKGNQGAPNTNIEIVLLGKKQRE